MEVNTLVCSHTKAKFYQITEKALRNPDLQKDKLHINLQSINTSMKQNVRQDMHPSGVNFEAIGQLKSKINARDPFLCQ